MLERRQNTGLDDAAREGLRRYRRHAQVLLVVGIVLFVAFTWLNDRTRDRAEDLQRNGARVPGVVAATCGCGEGGKVTARYVWDATVRTVTVRLNAQSRRYHVGQQVVVLVDRDDASHVSLLGEKNESSAVVLVEGVLLVGAAFVIVMGTWSLVRARRQRRLLRVHDWRSVPARWVRRRRSPLPDLAIETDDGRWQRVRLLAMTIWRLRASRVRGASEVQIADDGSGRAVVRGPASSVLVSARVMNSFVAADAPVVDPTRSLPDPKTLRRVQRVQLAGAAVFGVLALWSWSRGVIVPAVFYALAAVAGGSACHRVGRRAQHASRERGEE